MNEIQVNLVRACFKIQITFSTYVHGGNIYYSEKELLSWACLQANLGNMDATSKQRVTCDPYHVHMSIPKTFEKYIFAGWILTYKMSLSNRPIIDSPMV